MIASTLVAAALASTTPAPATPVATPAPMAAEHASHDMAKEKMGDCCKDGCECCAKKDEAKAAK